MVPVARREAPNDGGGDPRGGVICLGCGCLCDDLTVGLDGNQVVEFSPECERGRRWFEAAAAPDGSPACAVEGGETDADTAVSRAAQILSAARRPVVYGLTRTTTEAVRDAVALADRLRALVLLARTGGDDARMAAFQTVGRVGATLGEVKARADLVVFWGWDPLATHPRHGERYSIDAPGRFVPGGRAGRTVIVVNDRPGAAGAVADLVVPIRPEHDADLATGLRWCLRDESADIQSVVRSCGLSAELTADLAARFKAARYGALFFAARECEGRSARAAWRAVSSLVRDRNGPGRFVLLGPGTGTNLPGAEAALTWQAGFAQGVDFRRGYPAPPDDRATLDEVLAAGETDAILVISDELPEGLSPEARARLGALPSVVIGPVAKGFRPTVALSAAVCGIETTETVTRVDGVALPLRPLRPAQRPTDREWLAQIASALGEDAVASSAQLSPGRVEP